VQYLLPPASVQLTGDVSGKTSFLLVGAYAGRSKYYRGKEKGVRKG
jgi:BRCT domain type II-containing protein